MKLSILGAGLVLAFSALPVGAVTTTSDLRASCSGTYQVTELSRPVYKPAFGRAPAFAWVSGTVKVEEVEGSCQATALHYHLKMPEAGMVLNQTFGLNPHENLASQASQLLNQSHKFSLVQHFKYENKKGELPLFPLVHVESLEVGVGPVDTFGGVVDSKLLYGVEPLLTLSEQNRLEVFSLALQTLKQMAGSMNSAQWDEVYPAAYLELILSLEPIVSSDKAWYLTQLIELFDAVAEKNSSFTTGNQGVKIGGKINQINQAPNVPSAIKIELLKENPMLFDGQVQSWGAAGVNEGGPVMTPDELEQFLGQVAPEAGLVITNWNLQGKQIARSYQIRNAAAGILANGKPVGSSENRFYELTTKAKGLIEQILANH